MVSSKIYSLSKPPSQKEPCLHTFRHSRIIKHFQKDGNACHSLNSGGEVDFYLLLSNETEFDELSPANEEFVLNIDNRPMIEIEIYYEGEVKGIFSFDLQNPLDAHNLQCLLEKRRVNIYYINRFEEEFICSGIKTVCLPSIMCYDIQRYIEHKKPLLLPEFSGERLTDELFSEELLLKKAWGYYLDFTSLLRRIGSMEESEEIVTRHILHSITCLQRNKHARIYRDTLVIWVGRRVAMSRQNLPCESYSIYLSGNNLTGCWDKDPSCRIMGEALSEIPEYLGAKWIIPLAEEAIPIAALHDASLRRITLSSRFYELTSSIFVKNYLPHPDYKSYYHKILLSNRGKASRTKVFNLLDKLKAKGSQTGDLTSSEILQLVRYGTEEDLPRVFANLDKVLPEDIDELLVILCEKYREIIEPYLIPYLSADKQALKALAILGLGMIESKKAVPMLVENLKLTRPVASLARYAIALIGEETIPFVVKLLNDKRAEIRIRGLDTLALIGTPQALKIIRDLKTDRSKKVEQAKTRILSKLK